MTINRREALLSLAGSAAVLALSDAANAKSQPLPDSSLLSSDADAYWRRIRDDQFLMPNERAFLNTGSLGITPRPVLEAVNAYLEKAAALHIESGYPRWGYETLDEERQRMADFSGCSKDELAIVHNATEALSIIVGGMPLEPGAEVLITNLEHPSGRDPWLVRQAKGEISVRTVDLPMPPESPEQLLDVVVGAIGPKTRVVSFSGIMSPTGWIMPIQEICDAAREKGVISVVDGAHMSGQIDYRIDDMHCDYYAGSPHKWLFAPAGSGLLYINESRLDEHYPVIATAAWEDKELKAGRFMRFGTNNRAIIEGMMAGLDFALAIGPDRIYERIHAMAKDTYRRAREVPYLKMMSPEDDSMYGCLVTFEIDLPENKLDKLWNLCDQRLIWTTRNPKLRMSSHIHTRPEDLDLFFETLAEAAA